jgi:hypothetical protein
LAALHADATGAYRQQGYYAEPRNQGACGEVEKKRQRPWFERQLRHSEDNIAGGPYAHDGR